MTRCRSLALLGLGLVLAATAAADPPVGGAGRFVPAYFPPGPKSLQKVLACPQKPMHDKQVTVLCKVAISAAGVVETDKASGTFCAAPAGGPEAYRTAMTQALLAARFWPALIDGRPVPVYASVLGLFTQTDDGCSALALLNGGAQDSTMGIDYVEPQVVRDRPDWAWQRRVEVPTRTELPKLVNVARWPGMLFLRMSVAVAADGTVSDPRVDRARRMGHIDSLRSARALAGSRFIPGFYRGRPAPMRYFEILWVNSCRTENSAYVLTCDGGPFK